jgi:methylglutaconyl-CoA hydratase
MSAASVLTAFEDGVFTVVFNRPEAANRFTYEMMTAYIAALEAAHASGAVVLVVRAVGLDFTRGRDQSDAPPEGVTRADNLRLILRANELLSSFPGVSVALIQGRAMGFGTGIALHADISIAEASAVLGYDEITHGLAPLVVVAYLDPHVGPKVATELVVTGRDVGASEARSLGLLNRVVEDGSLEAAGDELVAQLSGHDRGALKLIARFTDDLRAGRLQDAGSVGVDRLDAWLAAGRPADG